MKKFIFSILFVISTMVSFSQTQKIADNKNTQKSHHTVVYKLFPTQNMWTFIKLNTRNGKMWQVQYDVQGDNQFETYLNILPLIEKEKEVNERFNLYPTQNMWNFILLDQYSGKTWQVQWSIEPEKRLIIPID